MISTLHLIAVSLAIDNSSKMDFGLKATEMMFKNTANFNTWKCYSGMITGDSTSLTIGQNHQYFAPAEMKVNLTKPL